MPTISTNKRIHRKWKLVEEELHETKALLETILHHTSDVISLLDLNGCIIRVNSNFEKMYGWKQEEAYNRKIPIIPEFLQEEMKKFYERVKSGNEIAGIETKRRRKDGKLIDVHVTLSPIQNVRGNVIAIAEIARDISEQKRSGRNLRESEQRISSLIEHNPAIICTVNLNGIILDVNPITEKVTGYTRSELVNRSIFDFLPFDLEEDISRFIQEYEQHKTESFKTVMKHKNGTFIDLGGKFVPIIVHDQIVGFYIIAKDITEIKRAEELLRKSEKLSAVGQLAAGVAHEIRNPLTTLKGFLQLLRSGVQNKEAYYEIMLSELNRIESIISELLVLAKPHVVQFQQKDIKVILKNIVTLFEPQALMANVSIEMRMEDQLPNITCEENQLKQVFVNLLKNAIESMPQGGKVVISARKFDEELLQIQFEDQGVGIPEEQIPKIGEPFFTTKENGTGLGLMVSYKIIENHNGKILIHSEVNKGTNIEIYLPIDFNKKL